MFQKLYDNALQWAKHRHAGKYLFGLSFAESSFFPIPPDVMLIPMCLARPAKSWFYAALCTLFSVLGGMAGYLIGSLAFGWIEPWLMDSRYAGTFTSAVAAFETWGFWYILLAGFTPIPYKVFTISAGVDLQRRGDVFDAVIDRADGNLYKAKQTGRNRVLPNS